MTPALSRSFAEQNGIRGVHFCDDSTCRFASWDEVVAFCEEIRRAEGDTATEFEERLLETMMSINPDNEYAVVRQMGPTIHIECYRAIT